MLLETGNIIFVKGTVFKDNGSVDTRENGHPVLILNSNRDEFYYLIMSSRMGAQDKNQYYCFENQVGKGKIHISYINLKYIYKRDIDFLLIRNRINDPELSNVMHKFIYYQENIKEDEYYNEVEYDFKRYKN